MQCCLVLIWLSPHCLFMQMCKEKGLIVQLGLEIVRLLRLSLLYHENFEQSHLLLCTLYWCFHFNKWWTLVLAVRAKQLTDSSVVCDIFDAISSSGPEAEDHSERRCPDKPCYHRPVQKRSKSSSLRHFLPLPIHKIQGSLITNHIYSFKYFLLNQVLSFLFSLPQPFFLIFTY